MAFEGKFKLDETYERGAALLVTLAYPNSDDAGRNFNFTCPCAAKRFGSST